MRDTLTVSLPGKTKRFSGLEPEALPSWTCITVTPTGRKCSRYRAPFVVIPTTIGCWPRAMAGPADIIVTGDPDLLVLEVHQGIEILSPRQFVERVLRGYS